MATDLVEPTLRNEAARGASRPVPDVAKTAYAITGASHLGKARFAWTFCVRCR
jgi:hypothetical protein